MKDLDSIVWIIAKECCKIQDASSQDDNDILHPANWKASRKLCMGGTKWKTTKYVKEAMKSFKYGVCFVASWRLLFASGPVSDSGANAR